MWPNTTNPPTFGEVIEADHRAISRLAGLTLSPNIQLSTRLSHLTTLVWRLTRHDISEELVMRPAFSTYLEGGARVADEDRRDHAVLKGRLLEVYSDIVSGREGEEEVLLGRVRALSDEMAGHMREESGMWLPRLEGVLGREVSVRLGWEYVRTLVLTPGECEVGVLEYGRIEVAVFKEMLVRMVTAAEAGADDGYLEGRTREEMAEIGLGLAEGSNERAGSMKKKGGEKL